MQNKQLCSFHSCIVRFEFSFGVLLSFFVYRFPTSHSSGNENKCVDLMRLGQASCGQATLLKVHKPTRFKGSLLYFWTFTHYSIIAKKWMKVIFLKIACDENG